MCPDFLSAYSIFNSYASSHRAKLQDREKSLLSIYCMYTTFTSLTVSWFIFILFLTQKLTEVLSLDYNLAIFPDYLSVILFRQTGYWRGGLLDYCRGVCRKSAGGARHYREHRVDCGSHTGWCDDRDSWVRVCSRSDWREGTATSFPQVQFESFTYRYSTYHL